MNNGLFAAVMLASISACLVTTAGINIIGRYADWANRNAVYFMSFAAGVLISVSFVHIIPKSFEMHDSAPLCLLFGFLALHIFNRFLNVFVCQRRECPELALGLIPMLGIGFHSFLDGVIYSVTFNVGIFTGIIAAIGTVMHEFPEGIVTFVLLEQGGFEKRQAAIYAFITAGLSTPLGTLVSFPFIQEISRSALGILLALSAGALLYVGASHLLPEVERANRRYTLISLASGILVAAGIVLTKQ